MNKECEKNKSKTIENNNNRENLTDEDSCAALWLASLKYEKLDEKSAVTLNKLKRKLLTGKDKQEEEASSVIRERNNKILVPNPTIFHDDYQPPDIPPVAALAGLIGECSKPYEKRLTETDLKDTQTRLSLSKNHVRESMIPLLKEDENVVNGIPVITYDSEGNEYAMRFVFWSKKMYALTTKGWKTFYRQHGLVKDIDIVTVWMFRNKVTDKLCFVITRRRR